MYDVVYVYLGDFCEPVIKKVRILLVEKHFLKVGIFPLLSV